ncbi:nucleotidyl transferase AbiEii/AbiGii toxin family protein [Paracoccus sp. YIM 132242]|uniref:Nucleotidyl transferase AbiEii/AbiGii toxin family protein n=1 Tax=Paracoccus lichenicola TaxID=2665644 RepID=A0A6L6HSN8_9RHOB|nr:nucleotidyl transferase AbiEii/AbiGii toxin family protein [Paracoccus lichenicola]MTE02206.1 nucleotidyl transferase AbiEii/AbiGii toxin family protein [Paracoccus lichenicola]
MLDEDEELQETVVSIATWVEKAKDNPVTYLERQATEVFLSTLGSIEPYKHQMFLKGGILMAVAYGSWRNTGDIDLSTVADPREGIAEEIQQALDAAFPAMCAELGYPDLMCCVQSYKYFPKGDNFPKNEGPAIKLRIGYAERNSPQEKHFNERKSPTALEVDISFKEPIGAIQILNFSDTEQKVKAYSLIALMAEKFRALLQQEKRNRHRRQDVYDLHSLCQRFSLDEDERQQLIEIFREKCAARGIEPNKESLEQPEIIERAKADWHTLELEVGELPEFDTCFQAANALYKSLPW